MSISLAETRGLDRHHVEGSREQPADREDLAKRSRWDDPSDYNPPRVTDLNSVENRAPNFLTSDRASLGLGNLLGGLQLPAQASAGSIQALEQVKRAINNLDKEILEENTKQPVEPHPPPDQQSPLPKRRATRKAEKEAAAEATGPPPPPPPRTEAQAGPLSLTKRAHRDLAHPEIEVRYFAAKACTTRFLQRAYCSSQDDKVHFKRQFEEQDKDVCIAFRKDKISKRRSQGKQGLRYRPDFDRDHPRYQRYYRNYQDLPREDF